MDNEVQPTPKNNNLRLFGVIGLILFVGLGGFIVGLQFTTWEKSTPNLSPTIQEQVIEPTKIPTVNPEWSRTNTLGVVSFEYPSSWHVAVLWPETGNRGINVTIDKEPINTAPRGGSLDDLNINVLNGITDPDEKLQEKINGFKSGLQNISETEIEGLAGKIKYIKGITNLYEELKPVEGYFFLMPSFNQDDKINYQVISTSIGSESKKAPYLKHIIESFKREY